MTTTTMIPAPTKGEVAGFPIYGQTFKVTSISFDWEVDNEDDIPSDEEKDAITNNVVQGEWVVVTSDSDWDEDTYADQLVNQITDETGWLVDTINYQFVTV